MMPRTTPFATAPPQVYADMLVAKATRVRPVRD